MNSAEAVDAAIRDAASGAEPDATKAVLVQGGHGAEVIQVRGERESERARERHTIVRECVMCGRTCVWL